MTITIYHNPDCATARNVLAMVRNSGDEPRMIEYLKTPPSRDELVDLLQRMTCGRATCSAARARPDDELGLDDPKWADDQLIDLMLEHPVLINRPIVVTELGVKLCRPSETVLEILPKQQKNPFLKEDGTPVA